MRLIFSLLLTSCAFGNFSFGASSFFHGIDTVYGLNYPVPPHDDRILFYVQRSNNINAIVYETNLNIDGTINREEPVHVYWKRYTSDSSVAELNYIQRKYAYGIESKEIEGKNGQFILNFVSYDKKKFYLLPDRDKGGYQALTMINGKMAILDRVFIRLSGGTFWFPTISNIELKGRDPLTKQLVVENFKP
ncbi:MAG TPA: DUF4833 domain-containing protein [Bacteroidia bacterium]|nr:DUF4833 domain-containing protein [Bacteroidia bacterium]